MKNKYFIYCRRSQDREDQQVLSIESQKRELLKYAKEHDLDIVDIICEDMSAYKRGRPKFNHMMEQIENGVANSILTWHLTRLARNGADGGLIITLMDEEKILELRTTEKQYINTGDDKFMMTIHFAMAKKSSDDTSSFVKNNLKTKLEKGEYPGVVPYGYLNIDVNGVIAGKRFDRYKQKLLDDLKRPLNRIELDPVESILIRKIIELALTGAYDLQELREEAFKIGIKGKLSGKKIVKQSIINILTNIFYTGKFEYLGEIHKGNHEPLMTEDEYNRIQMILKQRSRPKKSKHDYTYSSLVYCPECNNKMSGEYQKNTHYYRCSRAKGKNAKCLNTKHIRQDALDKEIEIVLKKLTIPEGVIKYAMKYLKFCYLEENKVLSGKRVLLQKDINSEKLKLERLTSKWLSDTNSNGELVSDNEYVQQKQVIQECIRKNEEQLKDNGNEEDNWLNRCEEFFKRLKNIKNEYQTSGIIGKRIILQSLGAKFVRKDERICVHLEKPFSLVLDTEETKGFIRTQKPLFKADNREMALISQNWLPELDSNQRPTGYTYLNVSIKCGLYLHHNSICEF